MGQLMREITPAWLLLSAISLVAGFYFGTGVVMMLAAVMP